MLSVSPDALFDYVRANTPAARTWLFAAPPALLWAAGCLQAAGWLKTRRGLRTGYTRKLFHFAIFTTVAVLQALWGTPAVCLFGACTTLVVFRAVACGAGHPWFEALARESDAPHRTAYVVIPYCATLLGGLAATLWFGPVALCGFLVGGIGDAIAEPVGARWGRHRYRVPCGFSLVATRSLEGSTAVALASALAMAGALLWLADGHALSCATLAWVPPVALLCAAVEAVSPHGWDNTTMQIVPAWLGTLLLGL